MRTRTVPNLYAESPCEISEENYEEVLSVLNGSDYMKKEARAGSVSFTYADGKITLMHRFPVSRLVTMADAEVSGNRVEPRTIRFSQDEVKDEEIRAKLSALAS